MAVTKRKPKRKRTDTERLTWLLRQVSVSIAWTYAPGKGWLLCTRAAIDRLMDQVEAARGK